MALQDIFRNLSIKNKLMAILMLTSCIVLLVASTAFFVNELISYRLNSRQDMVSMADLLGKNTAAALMFGDEKSAAETLESLVYKPNVLAAFVFSQDRELFASYISEAVHKKRQKFEKNDLDSWRMQSCGMFCHSSIPRNGRQLKLSKAAFAGIAAGSNSFWDWDGYFEVVTPIIIDGRMIGSIIILYDSSELLSRLLWFVVMVVIITIGVSLVAFFVSSKLQKVVSRPILGLAEVMKSVSEKKDYSLRAEKVGNDEIGALMDGFNEMLGQIKDRDEKLERYNEKLEENVQERTSELSRTNAKLADMIVDLRKTRDTAETANRAKSQFLANMSHEIRTPMNGVLGMTELLLHTELTQKQRKFAESAYGSAESLLGIIDDILDFSRIEAGKLKLENLSFNLVKTVRDSVELFSEQARRKGISLELEVEKNVPVQVEGDPGRLRQIFINIVGNAVKFTERGKVAVKVSTSGNGKDYTNVGIEVRDTGIGISPESLAQIFECFSQGDGSTTRKFGGTGLGLSISKQLVEMMGGGLSVESREGEGSVFRITVPLKRLSDISAADIGADEGVENTLPLPEVSDLQIKGNRGRILLAEDNKVNQEVCVEILTSFGFLIDIVPNGREAVEALSKNSYDLVLMDFQMPVMDGVEATR
nr:ATP-binding protein [Geobacteraceae bacterium]